MFDRVYFVHDGCPLTINGSHSLMVLAFNDSWFRFLVDIMVDNGSGFSNDLFREKKGLPSSFWMSMKSKGCREVSTRNVILKQGLQDLVYG